MASLLRPIALESCQGSLRSRRRSSASVIQAAAQLVSCQASSTRRHGLDEQVFIDDEDEKLERLPVDKNPNPPAVVLFPPRAHVADRLFNAISPRHSDASLPIVSTDTTTSPVTSSPPSITRKGSMVSDDLPDQTEIERLKWRLASGYFAYFMCGWGDGGKLRFTPSRSWFSSQ